MAWYDDAWEMAKSFGGQALEFAKENPTVAGAGVGLGLNAAFGKGENNLQAAGLGAALGYGASELTNNFTAAPSVGNWGGADGAAPTAPAAASVAGATAPAAPVSSAATMGTGAVGVGGAGKPGENAMGGYDVQGNSGITGDTGGPMMSQAKAGLGKIREFGKENEDVLRLAGKGISAYLGSQAKSSAAAPVQAYNEQYRGKADEAAAANTAVVEKKNALVDQQVSDYLAMDPQRAGKQAYAGTLSRISGQAQKAAEAETGKGYSAATVAANKRRGMVGATTGATTAAEVARGTAEGTRRAGLSGIAYQQKAVPTYDTSYASGVRDNADYGGAGSEGKDAYSMYEDVMGLSEQKAKKQVGT